MPAVAEAPVVTNPSVSDRAVLVNLSISQWSAAKSDKQVNREVSQAHGSREDMGNYRKQLVARDAVKKYTELASAIRQEFYKITLPWGDNGDRILTSKAYFDFSAKFRKRQAELESAWDDFCALYPQLVAEARQLLNGLHNSADYPAVSEIRGKFSIKLDVKPVPEAQDFRVNLGDEEIARLPGALRIEGRLVTVGPSSDVYAYYRGNTQRNLYRIPVP